MLLGALGLAQLLGVGQECKVRGASPTPRDPRPLIQSQLLRDVELPLRESPSKHLHFVSHFRQRTISVESTSSGRQIEELVPPNRHDEVADMLAQFEVDGDILRRLMAQMNEEMDIALQVCFCTLSFTSFDLICKGGESTMSMLPTFVPLLPDGTERGTYQSVDLGGTNLRITLVKLNPDAVSPVERIVMKYRTWKVPTSVINGGLKLFFFQC